MTEVQETLRHLDELLAYLPKLSAPGRKFCEGEGVKQTGPNSFDLIGFDYYDDVMGFFKAAEKPFWRDYEYTEKNARGMLDDPVFIARADLAQIKTMLTFCVRGERFWDGYWKIVLEGGRVQALLRRLQTIRVELAETS